eukprot:g30565.t1
MSVKDFIRAHQSWLLPTLDASRNLLMLLPGRFNEGEVRGEAVYTGLTLLCLYSQQVCGRHRYPGEAGRQEPRGAAKPPLWRCRYDLPQVQDTTEARRRRMLLQLLTMLYHSEVLIELLCERRFGGASAGMNAIVGKFKVIAVVEAIKALARLRLLRANHGRMLAEMSEEQEKEHQLDMACAESVNQLEEIPLEQRHMFHSLAVMYAQAGRAEGPHGRFKAEEATSNPRASSLWQPPPHEVVGEVLFHLRPLLYVLMFLWFNRRHSKENSKPGGSMYPWVLSLLVECVSRLLLPSSKELTGPLQQEMLSRNQSFLFYLVRSPVFERFSKPQILYLQSLLRKFPLGSLLGGLIDVLLSLQTHYFYTADSSFSPIRRRNCAHPHDRCLPWAPSFVRFGFGLCHGLCTISPGCARCLFSCSSECLSVAFLLRCLPLPFFAAFQSSSLSASGSVEVDQVTNTTFSPKVQLILEASNNTVTSPSSPLDNARPHPPASTIECSRSLVELMPTTAHVRPCEQAIRITGYKHIPRNMSDPITLTTMSTI